MLTAEFKGDLIENIGATMYHGRIGVLHPNVLIFVFSFQFSLKYFLISALFFLTSG
jgi:hypothetical protein